MSLLLLFNQGEVVAVIEADALFKTPGRKTFFKTQGRKTFFKTPGRTKVFKTSGKLNGI